MFKIPFFHGGIEYAKFTLVENQFMKLYSGGENLAGHKIEGFAASEDLPHSIKETGADI